jgi:hypothetical protein
MPRVSTRASVDSFFILKFDGLKCIAYRNLLHKPRRCLKGKNAWRAYVDGLRIRDPRRKREAVYRCIQELAAEVSTRAGKPVITLTAWRLTAKQ